MIKLEGKESLLHNPLTTALARRVLGRHDGTLPSHAEGVERIETMKDYRQSTGMRDPDITYKVANTGPYKDPHHLGRTACLVDCRDVGITRLKNVSIPPTKAQVAKAAAAHPKGEIWERDDFARLTENTNMPRYLEGKLKQDMVPYEYSSGMEFEIAQAQGRLRAAGPYMRAAPSDFAPHKSPQGEPPYLPPSVKAPPKTRDPNKPRFKARQKPVINAHQIGGGGLCKMLDAS